MREVELREEPAMALREYAQVSPAFWVDRIFAVASDSSGLTLSEQRLDPPYLKDYDSYDGGPMSWGAQFDLSNWKVIAAYWNGQRVGGVVVAAKTPNVEMLEDRSDLAVLWDIRVSAEYRGHNIGSRLFRGAENWAFRIGCRELKVETQNINVPACRFYERQGCALKAANRFAYKDFPNEIQLLWYKLLINS